MKKVALIFAMDLNRGIGKNNDLPWRFKKEMKHFVDITTRTENSSTKTSNPVKNAVLMGRKTWESIAEKFRPLKDRVNLVMTRNVDYDADGALVVTSFEEAFEKLGEKFETLFIIGGSSIYAQALEKEIVDEIYLTQIYKEFDCDSFFPELPESFDMKESLGREEEDGVKFEFFLIKKS